MSPTKPSQSSYTTITTQTFTHNGTLRQAALAQPPKKYHRKSKLRWILIVIVILFITGFGLLGWRSNSLGSRIFVGKKLSFSQKLQNLLKGTTGNLKLIGESEDQVNMLLLGIGGEGHEGPYLTDTIILAQIRPREHEAVLTTIPRDYMLDIKGLQGQKINAAFAFGMYNNSNNWNEAGLQARKAVESISGLTIPYFAVVDFKGFVKAIDQLGGITVYNDRSFTDYTFPDEHNGYLPPVTFQQGDLKLDGRRALIYARSRHAVGLEGSDFARSSRQQKVIQAFKQKATSLNLISDIGSINSLADIFADHFHTNLDPGELYHLFDISKNLSQDQLMSLPLDPANGLICSRILDTNGAYVLVPCYGKTEKDIKDFFQNAFVLAGLAKEKSVIWLSDSSKRAKVAKSLEKILTAQGITVYSTTPTDNIESQTTIFKISDKPATLSYLRDTIGGTVSTTAPSNFNADPSRVDFIVILGTDYQLPSPNNDNNSGYSKYKFREATTTPTNSTSTSSSIKNSTSTPGVLGTSTPTSIKNSSTTKGSTVNLKSQSTSDSDDPFGNQ